MTVHDLTEALEDTATLHAVAAKAGVTPVQARLVAAALGDLPVETAARICEAASKDRLRQVNRATRLDK